MGGGGGRGEDLNNFFPYLVVDRKKGGIMSSETHEDNVYLRPYGRNAKGGRERTIKTEKMK